MSQGVQRQQKMENDFSKNSFWKCWSHWIGWSWVLLPKRFKLNVSFRTFGHFEELLGQSSNHLASFRNIGGIAKCFLLSASTEQGKFNRRTTICRAPFARTPRNRPRMFRKRKSEVLGRLKIESQHFENAKNLPFDNWQIVSVRFEMFRFLGNWRCCPDLASFLADFESKRCE